MRTSPRRASAARVSLPVGCKDAFRPDRAERRRRTPRAAVAHHVLVEAITNVVVG